MRYFITGAAGFIGYHVAEQLLKQGHEVAGYDGMTAYYDPELKGARLRRLENFQDFAFTEGLLEDSAGLRQAVERAKPQVVIHLAAQAGVRYALEAPEAYMQSNVNGTFNLLEVLRSNPVDHFLFASTSSVYGGNAKMPFSETDRTDFPVSLYAATKKSGEAMCHTYAHLFDIPTTVFRFFTVYGPWGRPDMALFKFAKAIIEGRPIEVYGSGNMRRDFTYIDDLVDSIVALARKPPLVSSSNVDSISPVAPFRVVNIAGGKPTGLMEYISAIEHALGQNAQKTMLGMQPGDVVETYADPSLLLELTGNVPSTPVTEGVVRFISWYREYYG
ncbi:NAD-dependent epimerase/dehydratase family protein [Mycolicibacterium vaccae]|uniref:UDP-glucuronic acid epimerase n=1 Tax=Mycolicibacterium vaccae ATCC 25954 TaxID=1194972 RepID=K0V1T7_MYCVA|nr:NAD-dependent epimerase/dehydratase family protein [Mycolicibacterium vaccae]EJZ11335.1 UDP-glucuronic acid epimerase [Mycolicibacterium vaccae ATCC 25954]